MVGTQGSDVNQAQSLEEVMAAEGLSFFERTCWGDLNERWRALRGSPPPPQRRRHDSPPPTSPGALAAPPVLDEDGRPVIPEPPQPLQLPPQPPQLPLAHRDRLVDESGNIVDMDSIQFEVSNEVHHDRGLAIDVFDLSR